MLYQPSSSFRALLALRRPLLEICSQNPTQRVHDTSQIVSLGLRCPRIVVANECHQGVRGPAGARGQGSSTIVLRAADWPMCLGIEVFHR